MKSHKTSFHRLTVCQLRARRTRLARQLPDVEAMLRGSLQAQGRRCGKAGCHCAEGELHGPYTYLAVRLGDRSALLYVSAAMVAAVTRRVETTGRIEAALTEISAINLELLARGALD